MRISDSARWVGVSLLCALAACGGGGGSSPSPSPALTFAPATYVENAQFGQVGTGTLNATLTAPEAITGDLYILVSGTDGTFSTDWSLAQIDDSHYSITLHSLPSLAVGHHTGSATVTLCKDLQCSQPYPGVPATFAFDIDVEPAPLHATPTLPATSTSHWGAIDPDVVPLQLDADGLQWTASTTASWLVLDKAAGAGSATVQVSYLTTTALNTGDYSDTVTIASSDGQSVKIPFTLHVLPAAFELVGGVPSFNAVNGAPIAAQAMAFDVDTGASTAWTLSSDASWLSVAASGTATPGSALLQPDPSVGPLASGAYVAHLQLGGGPAGDVNGLALASNLTLVKPTLSSSVPAITLGGALGRDFSAQSLTLALDTGTNAYAWSASGRPTWLTTAGTGSVSQAGTPVTLSAAAAGVTPGSTSAVVTYAASVNGDNVTRPVTVNLNVDQRRLLPSAWGIGLSSSPTGSVLTRAIAMRDNFGAVIPWTAMSDKPWLTVTRSGDTGASSALVLVADPAGLADGGSDVASVTISSPESGVSPAVVRVGFWRSSSPAIATTLSGVQARHLSADRVLPFIYATADSTGIDVYNAFTAAKVATISNVGQSLGEMAVSADGRRLYVVDPAGQSLRVVDLASRTRVDSWPMTATSGAMPVVATRTNGVDLILLGDGSGYAKGRRIASTGIAASWGLLRMAAPDDGTKVYAVQISGNPADAYEWSLDYSEVSGGTLLASLSVSRPRIFSNGANGIASSGDGTELFAAVGAPGGCSRLDPATMQGVATLVPYEAGPIGVAATNDGRAVCSVLGWYSAWDISVFGRDGSVRGTYKFAGHGHSTAANQVVITPDGLVAVAPTDDPLLAFVPIGQ